MELDTKLYVIGSDGKKFMGIGVLWLLEEIDKSKSLRAASINMGLSYSKAYQMLKRLEESVGKPFLERKRGGANREGAEPTEKERSLLPLPGNIWKSTGISREMPRLLLKKSLSFSGIESRI